MNQINLDNRENSKPPIENRLLVVLQQILEDEIRQYETTADRLSAKKEILVSGKPKLLAQIDQELMTLGNRARQLEKQRQKVMTDLGYPDATLENLIQKMPPEASVQFNRMRDRLLRAVHDVSRLNRDNRDLLQLSLQWIQETVELISNALAPEGASYNEKGAKAKRHKLQDATSPSQSTINHSA